LTPTTHMHDIFQLSHLKLCDKNYQAKTDYEYYFTMGNTSLFCFNDICLGLKKMSRHYIQHDAQHQND